LRIRIRKFKEKDKDEDKDKDKEHNSLCFLTALYPLFGFPLFV
jgi:hypothetical protein